MGGSVVPSFVGEVSTKESAYLFRPGVLAVEEPTRGEVVDLLVRTKLLVGDERFLWVVL